VELYFRSVSIVIELWVGQPGFDSQQGQGYFFSLCHCIQIASGDTHPISNGYQGSFPRSQNSQDMKLTTHLCLALRLRKFGAILPLHHICHHSMAWHCIALIKHRMHLHGVILKHRDNFMFIPDTKVLLRIIVLFSLYCCL